VENKEKLLNPILSRFCEIYIPEYQEADCQKTKNLHQHCIQNNYNIDPSEFTEFVQTTMETLCALTVKPTHIEFTQLATRFYENGIPCMDIVHWVENTACFSELEKSSICMCYDNVKSEFRCEKLLMLYLFDFMFLRENKYVLQTT
jgi:hypothetical protein